MASNSYTHRYLYKNIGYFNSDVFLNDLKYFLPKDLLCYFNIEEPSQYYKDLLHWVSDIRE